MREMGSRGGKRRLETMTAAQHFSYREESRRGQCESTKEEGEDGTEGGVMRGSDGGQVFLLRGLPVLLFVCFILPSAAQVDRATLNGTVTDSSGAVITNAKVEATSAATALRRE